MKKMLLLIVCLCMFLFCGCSSKAVVKKAPQIKSYKAEVVSVKGVRVGEFKDGAKVVSGNVSSEIPVWDGFKLGLRTSEGSFFQYLSRDLYYEGDGVYITVKGNDVIKVKYNP